MKEVIWLGIDWCTAEVALSTGTRGPALFRFAEVDGKQYSVMLPGIKDFDEVQSKVGFSQGQIEMCAEDILLGKYQEDDLVQTNFGKGWGIGDYHHICVKENGFWESNPQGLDEAIRVGVRGVNIDKGLDKLWKT